MCRWHCTSEGPSTNLECLHCGTRFCAACRHGDAGKMRDYIHCARCGRKARHKSASNSRRKWDNDVGNSRLGVGGYHPATTGGRSGRMRSMWEEQEAHEKFVSSLRPEVPAPSKSSAADKVAATRFALLCRAHRAARRAIYG